MPATAAAQETFIQSRDGTKLYCRHWGVESPRASVALVHGYGEHCGRYEHVARYLNDQGLDVFGIDVRGHGKSDGIRGYVARFTEYHDDVDALLAWMKEKSSTENRIILGHSNGGLIVLSHMASRSPSCNALIVSAPFLAVAGKPPAIKLALGKLMSVVYPKLLMPTEIRAEHLSRDPAVGEAYFKDELVFKTVNVRWFTEAMATAQQTFRDAGRIKVPCLVMQGTSDPLADPAQARPMHDALGSTDKRYIEYEDFRHEILNENGKERVMADMGDFINAHLPAA